MTLKIISSPSHDLVKHFARLQKDHSYRDETNKIVVEGKNLLQDLVKRHRPSRIMVVERLLPLFQGAADEVIQITPQIAQKVSSVQSPEGCLAEFPIPLHTWPSVINQALVLDRLQDPGNMGTLLRTALAFDIRTIFCLSPSCDPWSPKVLRAAKGAQFDQTIITCSFEELTTRIDLPILVAELSGRDISSFSPPERWLLVLGNEAHGSKISSPTLLKIPMKGPVESLNVAQAGAILLYALCSQESV
jgi:TrmH family RNA methyltransferase